MPDYTDLIREAVAHDNYYLSYHAIEAMAERRVQEGEIITTIGQGEVIEKRPNDYPCPQCLFMYRVRPGERPLYVSGAYNAERQEAIIITLFWQDPEKWVDDRTRRR